MSDPLALAPPCGYAVRLALSHHLGGWKPCAGPPKCEQCVTNARRREWGAKREAVLAEKAAAGELPAIVEGNGPGEGGDAREAA